MDFSTLKSLAKKLGGILIVNGNEPDVVVLDYNKYMELENGANSKNNQTTKDVTDDVTDKDNKKITTDESALIDSLNKEIQALHDEMQNNTKTDLDTEETKEV